MLSRGAALVALALTLAGFGGDAVAEPRDYGPPASPFGDWTALGSGCRGGKAGGGDVVDDVALSSDPLVWRVQFHLASFRLDTAARAPGAPLTFARECGVRVIVAPPRGARLVFLRVDAAVAARKSARPTLTLAGELTLGADSLARRVVTYEPGSARSGEESFELAPGAGATMPRLDCGESRIVALDITWLVKREAVTDSAFVELAPATAELEVRLERC